jgi:nucleoid-associated protein YgaU
MQKDFKIGLLVGLIFVIVAALWLATRPSLIPEERLLRSQLGSGTLPTRQPADPLQRRTAKSRGDKLSNAVAAGSGEAIRTVQSQPSESVHLQTKATGSDRQLSKIEIQQTVPDMTIYEQAEKIRTQRFHIVLQGDTLSAISRKYYGSANKWRKILHANRSQISDANKIQPGTKLIIPD